MRDLTLFYDFKKGPGNVQISDLGPFSKIGILTGREFYCNWKADSPDNTISNSQQKQVKIAPINRGNFSPFVLTSNQNNSRFTHQLLAQSCDLRTLILFDDAGKRRAYWEYGDDAIHIYDYQGNSVAYKIAYDVFAKRGGSIVLPLEGK